MRPLFEQVNVPLDQSWTLFDRRLPTFPFNWHYHSEFELTLSSVGERFVGDHIEHYGDGDLVLVGPNLPHAWQSRGRLRDDALHRALVAWFTQAWVDKLHTHYVEFASLRALLAESVRGLTFSADVCAQAARWLGLVEVLLLLASDTQRQALALQGFLPVDNPRDRARLERVMSFLNAHYTEPIRLAAMSKSQLQRFFKRCTRMTVSDYLNHSCGSGAHARC